MKIKCTKNSIIAIACLAILLGVILIERSNSSKQKRLVLCEVLNDLPWIYMLQSSLLPTGSEVSYFDDGFPITKKSNDSNNTDLKGYKSVIYVSAKLMKGWDSKQWPQMWREYSYVPDSILNSYTFALDGIASNAPGTMDVKNLNANGITLIKTSSCNEDSVASNINRNFVKGFFYAGCIRVSSMKCNMEMSRCLLKIDFERGPERGNGELFFLKKYRGHWVIEFNKRLWIS